MRAGRQADAAGDRARASGARRCRRAARRSSSAHHRGLLLAAPARRRPIELGAAIGRHVVDRRALAELQRADVGGDRPAVGHRHLRRVVLHRAEAVRHHVEEIADRRVAQPLVVERRRRPEAALHDHAVALARAAVARRAEHVEPLLPARHHLGGHRHRETCRRAGRRSCRRRGARPRAAAARDGVGHQRRASRGRRRRTCSPRAARSAARRACPGGTPPPDAGRRRADAQRRRQTTGARAAESRSTAQLRTLPADAGSRETLASASRSNRGSVASMQRKNRSRDARANAGTLNTG